MSRHVALAQRLCQTHSMGEMPKLGFLGLLRRTALTAVLVGAAGSLGLMLLASRRQNSRILLLLFAIWVLSPFIALVGANVVSKRWPMPSRATLYGVMLVLTLGSLAIYGGVAFGYAKMKVGFVFLIVPLASWLVIAIVVLIATLKSNTVSGGRDGAYPAD